MLRLVEVVLRVEWRWRVVVVATLVVDGRCRVVRVVASRIERLVLELRIVTWTVVDWVWVVVDDRSRVVSVVCVYVAGEGVWVLSMMESRVVEAVCLSVVGGGV